MRRCPKFHAVLHFAPLLLLPALKAQTIANLLSNGSFEVPVLSSTQNISGVFTLSGGWSGVACSNGGNAGLVVGTDNGLAPAEGNQHFNLNGGNPSDRGWLEQSFATVVGESYLVSFAVGRAGGGQDLSLLASVGPSTGSGQAGASVSAAPPGGHSYSYVSFSFVAVGSTSTLRFTDTSGGNSISDLYLDDVSVTAVSAIPEPGTYAVIAGGCVLLAALRRARPFDRLRAGGRRLLRVNR